MSSDAWMFSFSVNRVIANGVRKIKTYIIVKLLMITLVVVHW